MTENEYKVLVDSCVSKKRDNGDEFYCLKDGLDKSIEQLIHDVMYEIDESFNFDLRYSVLNDALNALSEIELKDLPEFDPYETESEYASVYTDTRLSYLNNWNQDEITEKMKEYDCDIQTACAVWYDDQVKELLQALKAKILES